MGELGNSVGGLGIFQGLRLGRGGEGGVFCVSVRILSVTNLRDLE